MKPVVLGLVALAVAPALHANTFADPRIGAMGGAGVASGDFTNAHANPALLTRFQEGQSFSARLGVGAIGRDYEDTIDDVDALQDTLDDLESALNNLNPTDAERLAQQAITQLENLDGTEPSAEVAPALGFYVPSTRVGFALTFGATGYGEGLFTFVESDRDVIEQSLVDGNLNQDDLESFVDANAVLVSELTLSFATQFNAPHIGDFSVGIAPKMQRLDSYFYRATAANFDEDDITSDENMTDSTQFNLDLGLHKSHGDWHFGLVGRNLLGHSVTNVDNAKLELKPSYVAAVAFERSGFTAAFDLDLIEDKSFEAFRLPSQWAKLGLEYDFAGHFQLRGGYRSDLASNHGDRATVGLGISPGRLINLDLTGEFGDDDEIGARVQLGLNF
ncbi:conjugal transfer protein TraF [Ferrimonas marina]|uniref:Plasmid transfer operon, TraF, protein n=1 Tax=Ferrimonas marina TaxID=299255 RepID=A0A1M5XYF7_9GAMM|nr:conjugal transfer protein TraF [Ferrimonas marina]SHI04283.1 plasmid transfer operon, TraF, protein [Ferrimonas marina]